MAVSVRHTAESHTLGRRDMWLSWWLVVGLSTARASPASARERFDEGQRLSGQKRWGEALAEFRAAARADPDFTEAWYAISLSEMRVRGDGASHCEEMHDPLVRVLELDPKARATVARASRSRALKSLSQISSLSFLSPA